MVYDDVLWFMCLCVYVFTALLYRVLGASYTKYLFLTNLKFYDLYKPSSYVCYRSKWIPSSNIHKAFMIRWGRFLVMIVVWWALRTERAEIWWRHTDSTLILHLPLTSILREKSPTHVSLRPVGVRAKKIMSGIEWRVLGLYYCLYAKIALFIVIVSSS